MTTGESSSEKQTPPRKMSIAKKVGCGCAIALALALVGAGIFVALALAHLDEVIDGAYAQWGAGDMVVGYLYEHDDEWPPNWEALRESYERGGGRLGGVSFEEYQQIVEIDFDVDVEELRRQAKEHDYVPFDVIRSKTGWGGEMGDGPDAQIYRYLRGDSKGGVSGFVPKSEEDWNAYMDHVDNVETQRAERRMD